MSIDEEEEENENEDDDDDTTKLIGPCSESYNNKIYNSWITIN